MSALPPNTAEIMIVDDNSANVRLLAEMLVNHGYVARKATTGILALRSLQAKPSALILLDVRMPEIDGFEVCRRLKADPLTRSIPVIFITVLEASQDKAAGFAAGAVDFITKPFEEAEVLARVRTHLELRRYQSQLEDLVGERTAQLQSEITEREQAEAALRESNQRYQSLFNHSPVSMLLIHPVTGQIMDANAAACAYYGYDLAELAAMRATDADALISGVALQEMRVGALGRRPVFFQHRLKNGELRDVEVYSGPLLLAGERLIYAVVHDATVRRQAEAALRASEQRFHMLARLAPVGIFQVDASGQCTYVNETWCTMSGLSEAAALGDGWTRGVYAADRDRVIARWKELVASRQEGDLEFRFQADDGRVTWVYGLTARIDNEFGQTTGFVGITLDITQRKQAETERESLLAQLHAKNVQVQADAHIKAALLDEVNHRVKNNLMRIQSILQLKGREPALSAGEHVLLLDMHTRIASMLTVHSMLSNSQWLPLTLGELCQQVIHGVLQASFSRPEWVLEASFLPANSAGQLIVPGQATTLALILNELTMNSVKYAFAHRDDGHIWLSVKVSDEPDGRMLEVRFQDDGPGWPAAVLDGGGTGLGLRLVRNSMRSLPYSRLTLQNDGGAAAVFAFKLAQLPSAAVPALPDHG